MVGTVAETTRRAYIGLPFDMADERYVAAFDVMWESAVALVDAFAPDAPEAISNCSALAVLAYLWSHRSGEVSAAGVVQPGDALRKSGALSMLLDYRVAGAVTLAET